MNGTYSALLAIQRSPADDLDFILYTNANGTTRTSQLVQQAAAGIAISDRLGRSGSRPRIKRRSSPHRPSRSSFRIPPKTGAPVDTVTFGTQYLLGFGMSVLILMMVILYGQWIAMSVVEEKSSRVMEVVLNAASPLELLTGKVLGVGSVALLQYLALLATGLIALLVQGPVASVVLGEAGADVALPEGLSAGVLLVFGVYGVLGFLLYGVLYAAAGSLVSRQEDVQTVVMPLALISTAGYLIAVYGSIGLLDSSSAARGRSRPGAIPESVHDDQPRDEWHVVNPRVPAFDHPPGRRHRRRARDREPPLRGGCAAVRPEARGSIDASDGSPPRLSPPGRTAPAGFALRSG